MLTWFQDLPSSVLFQGKW